MSGSSDTTSRISWDSGEAASDREDSEFSYGSTEGHGNRTEQSQNLHVESQTTSDVAAPKAAEGDSDTPWHVRQNPSPSAAAGPSGTTHNEPQSPNSSNFQRKWCPPPSGDDETTPLLDPGQPISTPGASLPCGSATLNGRSCGLKRAPSNYLVFGGRNDPQPMGDINSESPGSERSSRAHSGSSKEKLELCFRCFSLCIKAITIIAIFALLSWMIQSTKLNPFASLSTPKVGDVSLPSVSDDASQQTGSSQMSPPLDYTQPDDHHPHCPVTSKFSKSYEFNSLTDFTLQNLIRPVRFVRVYGSVHVLPAPSSQKEDIKVNFTFDTSDLTLQNFLKVEASDSSLTIDFPTSPTNPEASRGCIHTHTSIYLRSALSLSNLMLESRVVDIRIPALVDLTVKNSTNLYMTAGTIDAEPFFKSRKTFVDVDAGSVYGSYPLYDILSIRTQAGGIGVDVVPQSAQKDDAQPAEFIAHSQAGSIRVDYPPPETDIPDRDYRVDVKSEVGSISGRFLHGTNTVIRTQMGDVRAEVLPYAADQYESALTTQNQMGSQEITVLAPYTGGQTAIRRLKSKHLSDSGGIKTTYPRAWEGNIKAESDVGTVAVRGPGVEIVRQGRKGVGMFIEAKKGDGQGQGSAEISTVRGSVYFDVNRECGALFAKTCAGI